MANISKQQINHIYALGSSLGLVEHGADSHADALHQLVGAITGHESISALSGDEASRVIGDLMHKMRGFPAEPKPPRRSPKKYEETPGGLTTGQQRKVWELMYELKKFDTSPVDAPVGARLCGIIRRQFRVDAALKDPFHFLSWEQGRQLIEILKKYCYNAEIRKIRAGDGA